MKLHNKYILCLNLFCHFYGNVKNDAIVWFKKYKRGLKWIWKLSFFSHAEKEHGFIWGLFSIALSRQQRTKVWVLASRIQSRQTWWQVYCLHLECMPHVGTKDVRINDEEPWQDTLHLGLEESNSKNDFGNDSTWRQKEIWRKCMSALSPWNVPWQGGRVWIWTPL